jgi:CPA1 family monovalent cation:H+ antiporter
MHPDNRNPFLPEKEQERILRKKLAYYGLQFLNDGNREVIDGNRGLQQLRARFENDQLPVEENIEQVHEDYHRVYLQLLERQRKVLHELNKKNEIEDEVVRKYLTMLDLEEEKLRMKFEGV